VDFEEFSGSITNTKPIILDTVSDAKSTLFPKFRLDSGSVLRAISNIEQSQVVPGAYVTLTSTITNSLPPVGIWRYSAIQGISAAPIVNLPPLFYLTSASFGYANERRTCILNLTGYLTNTPNGVVIGYGTRYLEFECP
jgi:hypothetical protein